MKAILALADGRLFRGRGFGARGRVAGEVVFNTSMSGYQEILTDPSYCGQIVVMTYPEIGNVGVNREDVESEGPFLSGFVVKEYWRTPCNWRADEPLHVYMERYGIVGIEGVDTRALVRHIREAGAQQAILATGECDEQALVAQAAAASGMQGRDLATGVSTVERYRWLTGNWQWNRGYRRVDGEGPLVATLDFGIKYNILRNLCDLGCRVAVLPASTTPAEVRELQPDGLFLSNGPGDPDAVRSAVACVSELLTELPTFGICLGHQILALALGGKTYKMKFGHHGANQPVLDLDTGAIEITAQNHGFAVDAASLPAGVRVTHVNLNDQTVEGLAHETLPVFSVQYHPEASPGPHDAGPLFKRFRSSMKTRSRSQDTASLPPRGDEPGEDGEAHA